jgi:hypothetical protein
VGVGVGVEVSDGDADAEADAEDVADAEDTGVAGSDGGTVGTGTNVGSTAGGAGVLGPGVRERFGLTLGGDSLLAAGALGVVVAARDWAARAPAVCRPVTVISVALRAATTHSATAAAAVAAPGLLRILSQLKIPRTSPGPSRTRRSRVGQASVT